jgi:multiple sugar transport system substrate-binding protein
VQVSGQKTFHPKQWERGKEIAMPNVIGRRSLLVSTAAGLASPAIMRRAQAADTVVQLISHRYPALEYYAEKMKTALPGVTVDGRLMPSGDAIQLQRIQLSSGASTMDIMWCNSITIPSFAKSGWLEPLDDLWEKHRKDLNLDDISPAAIKGCSYNGHIYAIPLTINTLTLAYRADVFEEKKLEVPKTWDEYVDIAKTLNSPPRRYGVSASLKWDQPPAELQSVLNTVGDGWFDKDWKPTFNSDRGVKAIETYKRLAQYAVPGFTAMGNDECTVNLGQDIAVMAEQWATRCSSMDNPDKSHVVGRFKWAVPPGGHQATITDAYAISKFSTKDKDMLFRLLAATLNEDNQRGAAALAVPPRRSVLNDPAIQAKYRWYPAISQCLDVAVPLPQLPEFSEVGEVICKRMVQAIVGQMEVKPALDEAAKETVAMLQQRGYYK